MVFDYDLIVIGGGSGGLVASKLALGLGKSVAIVEKDRLGGECTNTGCVPSKALIKCGQVARDAQNLNKYGLSNQGAIALNTDKVMDHVRSIIQEVYQTHTPEKLRETGIGVIKGAARFIDRNTIEVGGKRVRAKKFIITTGSSPFVPSIDGLDTVDYLTNENLFELDTLPESIVIIGGGAIGAEMACALNNLGVKVTIVEMQDRMLVHEDEELVEILQAHLREQGITILTNTAVVQVAKDGERVVITCKDEKGNQDVLTEKVLVAVGRQPNLDGLNLDGIGVKTNKRGIETNNKLQTSVPNIYACGDVVGPYQFSHMAFYQAVIAGRNALFPFGPKLNYDNVIWCTFTGPELAHAGLTEQEARKKFGDSIQVFRKPYSELDRSKTDDTMVGLGKFICDKSGRLIGVQILGARAGEVIHEVQLGKYYNIKFAKFYNVIHAYPTYSELVWHAARMAYVEGLKNHPVVKIANKISGLFRSKKK